MIILLLIPAISAFSQKPKISYASSCYKTTAGAIGPSGVVNTTTFELKIENSKTIILDSLVLGGFSLQSDGVLIPADKEGLIEIRLVVFTHQKDSVWHNGRLTVNDISVDYSVNKVSRGDYLIRLYGRSSGKKLLLRKKGV